MHKIIKIKKQNLIFRNQVKEILKNAKAEDIGKTFLDFSNVGFVSRSFADEFLERADTPAIKIIRAKPEVEKLLLKVKQTRKKIAKEMGI